MRPQSNAGAPRGPTRVPPTENENTSEDIFEKLDSANHKNQSAPRQQTSPLLRGLVLVDSANPLLQLPGPAKAKKPPSRFKGKETLLPPNDSSGDSSGEEVSVPAKFDSSHGGHGAVRPREDTEEDGTHNVAVRPTEATEEDGNSKFGTRLRMIRPEGAGWCQF